MILSNCCLAKRELQFILRLLVDDALLSLLRDARTAGAELQWQEAGSCGRLLVVPHGSAPGGLVHTPLHRTSFFCQGLFNHLRIFKTLFYMKKLSSSVSIAQRRSLVFKGSWVLSLVGDPGFWTCFPIIKPFISHPRCKLIM